MRCLAVAVVGALAVSACASGPTSATSVTSTTIEDYPDAQTRAMRRLAAQPRPVEPSAIPPRHLEEDVFPTSLVDRTRIVSGGPPPDGIASLDDPGFVAAAAVDWLEDDEAVIVLEVGPDVRVYPVQIMAWHEIVNDEIGGEPITVTYCPLCNSAVAYRRTVEGTVLDFGTSGALYQSALVMYDRQTESLWTHFDGRSVVGTMVGHQLELVPVSTVSWSTVRQSRPDARVLDRDTGFGISYGRNRYVGYDQADNPLRGFFTGDVDDRLAPLDRVVGVGDGDTDEAVAVPLTDLAANGVVALADAGLVVFWQPGTASSLQASTIAAGDDIGASGVFRTEVDGRVLDFRSTDVGFVDRQTGTTWSLLGEAIGGPLEGARLVAVPHLDTFWFAWSTYHPSTTVAGG